MIDDPDWPIRMAAFAALERLAIANGGRLAWRDIAGGFQFRSDIVRFAGRPRGIFKPRQMSAALSVKALASRRLRVPDEAPLQPRREYLEQRFAQFAAAQP